MKTMRKIQQIGFATLARREIIRVFRIWSQTLLPSVITTALYFLIFGNVIGNRIDMFNEFTYIQFIVPGLIMMAVITNSYTNVVSSVFITKFQRDMEEILVSPLTSSTVVAGFLMGGILRGIIVGILVTIVSLIFAPLTIHNFFLITITIILTAIFFSLAGFINAIYAKSFDNISIVPTFILTPLTYLGGVFYSIDLLPDFFQKLSLLNPILYLVNIFRYGFLGVSDISITTSLLVLILLTGLFWWFCIWLLNKGIGLRT